MTDDRKCNTGGEVELLPLPKADVVKPHFYDHVSYYNQDTMHAYARANVDRALAESRAEVSGLRAARMAYASEFPLNADGEPDVGNVHANIRALKARAERLAEALRELVALGHPNDPAIIAARAALNLAVPKEIK